MYCSRLYNIHKKIKDKLIAALKIAIKDAFGEKPIESKSYGRLINKNHLDRINKMMKGASIIHGGDSNSSDKFFAPTLLYCSFS